MVFPRGQPAIKPRVRSYTMMKVMTGAQMVIEALVDQGVEHIFGYPGGAVLPIYDALFEDFFSRVEAIKR